jgi:hypothetical protein
MANVRNDELATARVFRARSELDASRTLVPRSQWMRDCEPRCSDEEADRIWAKATESLVGSSTLTPLPPSPSSFTGGNTLKVTAELAHPSKPSRTEAKVAIDTQSDVTTALREYLTDVKKSFQTESQDSAASLASTRKDDSMSGVMASGRRFRFLLWWPPAISCP